MRVLGSPGNPGGPVVSISNSPVGESGDQPRPLRESAGLRKGAKLPAHRWYPRPKATKAKEKDGRESDRPILPQTQGNFAQEDPGEGRGRRNKELLEGTTMGTPSPSTVSTKLQKIAKMSRSRPAEPLTVLAHHIDLELMKEAFRLIRKNGAVGVDGVTAQEYQLNLEGNLISLVDRFKSGAYKAPPVKRVYIPKGDGKRTRPIGIPTLEDKILQKAVTMVLEAVYEQDFLDCSYGFRPKRSAHQALESIWRGLMATAGGYVLEADISKYFDMLDHSQLRAFLDMRVRDGVIRRAIDKWLKAGILEENAISYPKRGTPQGGVISPLLANVYLHEVLDKWIEAEVKPRLAGRTQLVRYADDFLIFFSVEADAHRIIDVLHKRFARFGLSLHPDKTKLVCFKHPCASGNDHTRQSDTFDFLGFTHYWGRSRRGGWSVCRKTAKDRFKRALKSIALWCRENRHLPVNEQQQGLVLKLGGHYQYYGITGNGRSLKRMRYQVCRVWHKWLCRRSQRAKLDWHRFNRLLMRYPLPQPRIFQSYTKCAANP